MREEKIKMTSRHDIEVTIAALGIEDGRQKEALRRFYARERAQDRAASMRLLAAIGFMVLKITAVGIAAWLILSGWLPL